MAAPVRNGGLFHFSREGTQFAEELKDKKTLSREWREEMRKYLLWPGDYWQNKNYSKHAYLLLVYCVVWHIHW